ncbi:MAG TPA: acyltransferase [Streptosporangiaceae bacterium]|nr:acyltransferase [Streptosporangiaceae bacterium]
MARRWLGQVDAMRPVKQVGVVSTHSILFFAPAAATVGSGAALLLLHVSREGFFFISACMLTCAYADLFLPDAGGLGRFYRRRCVSVLIPYVCWNVIYFLYLLPTAHYASAAAALGHLAFLLAVGYYQLYFLLVIMQFYLVFPLVLILLRRTRGHHGLVLAVAAAAQVAIAIATHWGLFPALMLRYAQQDALSYLLYLIGGSVVAFHLDQVHAWVCTHARLILFLTFVAGLVAEGIYFLAQDGVTSVLGSGSDPFQPSVIAFNIGAITCGYLAGVALVKPGRSARTRSVVRTGSEDAYGIYLSQMLFIIALTWLGWGKLSSVVPWPVLCLLTVGIVFACAIALTSLLARTPLAVPLTGRKQVPWPRPRLRSRLQLRESTGPVFVPAELAGVAGEKNGS